MSFLKVVPEGVQITVRVSPGASRDRIIGPHGSALKVQVSAPPERGRANAAVAALIAARLGIPPRDITIVRGQTAANKVLLVRELQIEDVRRVLEGRGFSDDTKFDLLK